MLWALLARSIASNPAVGRPSPHPHRARRHPASSIVHLPSSVFHLPSSIFLHRPFPLLFSIISAVLVARSCYNNNPAYIAHTSPLYITNPRTFPHSRPHFVARSKLKAPDKTPCVERPGWLRPACCCWAPSPRPRLRPVLCVLLLYYCIRVLYIVRCYPTVYIIGSNCLTQTGRPLWGDSPHRLDACRAYQKSPRAFIYTPHRPILLVSTPLAT